MTDEELDVFITTTARALTLIIGPNWRPSVRTNLAVTFRHAEQVMQFSLPDDAEPAPIYRA